MSLTMNGRDQAPLNQLKFEPVEMPLGKHIDKHVNKLKDVENIDQLLLLVIGMSAYLGAQGKIVSRQSLVELLPRIKEKTKISAATWNNHAVYWLAGIGAAISIVSGIASTAGTFSVLSTGDALAREAMNKAGTAIYTDKLQASVQQDIANQLTRWTSIQSIGSGLGGAFKTIQELKQGNLSGDRVLSDHDIDRLKLKRDTAQQSIGSMGQKADEAGQQARDLAEKKHRAMNGG